MPKYPRQSRTSRKLSPEKSVFRRPLLFGTVLSLVGGDVTITSLTNQNEIGSLQMFYSYNQCAPVRVFPLLRDGISLGLFIHLIILASL